MHKGGFIPSGEKQVSSDHYNLKYDHLGRWVNYHFQIKEALSFNPKNILLIGKGNGLVQWYLEQAGSTVTTVDIASDLHPDILADVRNIPVEDKSFDVVICCEVLEHLPFEQMNLALEEIARIARSGVIFSFPDARKTLLLLKIKIPILPLFSVFLRIPSFKKHIFDGEHYWEIGKRGYSPKSVRNAIKNEFIILREYSRSENPLAHFFISMPKI